ncbi:DDE superfamily endonuclease [Rhizoctonia solani]|uniref:DDE superfamily endonuclease n=1 Tax=Rhizoctonia solani TaxID=456999 RepID=A0A8H8P4J8_9AGAM|nr:DDE superfamily endonuclease [Rhizoctonia solani]QRW24360.1 DDE superfamily endonuclease [Rhizoctonia solani]
MSKVALQVVFALVPSTVLRYINFALDILLEILKEIPEAHLAWPTEAKMQENSHLITRKHCGAKYLDGAFGFMDGLNLPLQASGDHNKQNANYNGWLHKHVISNIIVFLPEGTIMVAVMNAPGSWHDSNMAWPIYDLLRHKTPNSCFLIANSAFPCLGVGEAQKIKVPLKINVCRTREQDQESQEVTTARQAVEWGMQAIQGCFS